MFVPSNRDVILLQRIPFQRVCVGRPYSLRSFCTLAFDFVREHPFGASRICPTTRFLLLASCKTQTENRFNLAPLTSFTPKGLLELFTVGAASAATVHRLRPVLLLVTIILLADRLRRRGPTFRNLIQIALCGALLLLPGLLESVRKLRTLAPTRSCH